MEIATLRRRISVTEFRQGINESQDFIPFFRDWLTLCGIDFAPYLNSIEFIPAGDHLRIASGSTMVWVGMSQTELRGTVLRIDTMPECATRTTPIGVETTTTSGWRVPLSSMSWDDLFACICWRMLGLDYVSDFCLSAPVYAGVTRPVGSLGVDQYALASKILNGFAGGRKDVRDLLLHNCRKLAVEAVETNWQTIKMFTEV